MSDFKKVCIYVDENRENSTIDTQLYRIDYLQDLVDKYNALKTGVPLAKGDLVPLVEAPRAFVAKRLIDENQNTIGGMQLDLDKVFDIIVKPVGTDELIHKIISDRKTTELLINHRHADCFSIVDGTTVTVSEEYLARAKEQASVYLSTETQAVAYEALKVIAENVNKLNNLKSRGHIQHLLFDELLILNNSNQHVSVNPYFIKVIN